jgi:hypothetical protein
MAPRPFRVEVPDSEIAFLKARLAGARYPDALEGIAPWEDGTDAAYFKARAIAPPCVCAVLLRCSRCRSRAPRCGRRGRSRVRVAHAQKPRRLRVWAP